MVQYLMMIQPMLKKQYKFIFSPSGKKDRPVYKYVYDEKYGCPRRVLNGYYDFHDFIQEGRDNVDFKSLGEILVDSKKNIIDHFVDKDGQIVDVTGQPRNIHEANKLYNDLRESFNSLPDGLKALFDNDFETFRGSYNAGTMGSKIEGYYKSLEPPATLKSDDSNKEGE